MCLLDHLSVELLLMAATVHSVSTEIHMMRIYLMAGATHSMCAPITMMRFLKEGQKDVQTYTNINLVMSSNLHDCFGEFRCHFRMPLAKVDDLVHRFLENMWIHNTKQCMDNECLKVKAQLLIL